MLNNKQKSFITATAQIRTLPLLLIWGFCFFLIPMMITSLGVVSPPILMMFLSMFIFGVSTHYLDKYMFNRMFQELEKLEDQE